MLHGLKKIFLPSYCTVCSQPVHSDGIFCTRCSYELPRTRYHHLRDNSTSDKLAGRFNFDKATSLYYCRKGSSFLKPIYRLKYNGHTHIGEELGRMLGYELAVSGFIDGIDAVIPVPLHPHKQKKRGYNQCSLIAKGLSSACHIPVIESNLLRVSASGSQTKKGRELRWEELKDAFAMKNAAALQGKHVLLVDDIITTGATIEACVSALSAVEGLTVSIASVGLACD